jgi:chemotaxis protein MotB
VDPARLAVIGLGEFRPAQSNATIEGRNANRRVLIIPFFSASRRARCSVPTGR